jgi:recombinational DNA repair protein RecR
MGKKIYILTKNIGCPEAGVLRLYYSIGNILRKLQKCTENETHEYQNYIYLCKETAREPNIIEVIRFFRYYGLSKRFLVMRINPKLLL